MALTHGCCGTRNDGPHADGCYINDRLAELVKPQTVWDEAWPTWEQVNEGELTPLRRILIQCIASLTVQPQFADLTPWQTYEKIVIWARQIAAKEAAV